MASYTVTPSTKNSAPSRWQRWGAAVVWLCREPWPRRTSGASLLPGTVRPEMVDLHEWDSILSCYQQRFCLKEKLVESDIMRWSTSWYVVICYTSLWNSIALDTFRTLGTEHHCFPHLIWTLSVCASQGAPLGSSLLLRTGPSGYSMGWSLGQQGSGSNPTNQSFIQDSLASIQIETQTHSSTIIQYTHTIYSIHAYNTTVNSRVWHWHWSFRTVPEASWTFWLQLGDLMNFLSVARLSIFTWKTCKAKLTWCLRRWDSKESVVTQGTQEVCLIWLIGVIAGVMNSKNYELEVYETWWNLDSYGHGRSYTWRGLHWLPTSNASRNLSRYFKCAHAGLWRAFASWTRLAVHQAGCHSAWLSLCCWPKKVDRTMNEHDFYTVSNTSRTRCESSKVWGELPIFYDVQRSLDCFSWFAQTHWSSFIIQNAEYLIRPVHRDFSGFQVLNACHSLTVGQCFVAAGVQHVAARWERAWRRKDMHTIKCWFGSVLICFRSVGLCLISSYFIFYMLGTAVNLTWRQMGSCRPFCKLQVCVRDDREVRDESCRSFTRNFGGAIFGVGCDCDGTMQKLWF